MVIEKMKNFFHSPLVAFSGSRVIAEAALPPKLNVFDKSFILSIEEFKKLKNTNQQVFFILDGLMVRKYSSDICEVIRAVRQLYPGLVAGVLTDEKAKTISSCSKFACLISDKFPVTIDPCMGFLTSNGTAYHTNSARSPKQVLHFVNTYIEEKDFILPEKIINLFSPVTAFALTENSYIINCHYPCH